VRRGGRARWMGPGGAALLSPAVVAAAGVLIAGCVQAPSGGLPPRGRPAVAQVREPAGGGPLPPTGSRSQARTLAVVLLSRLVLPPGAREIRPQGLPQLLPQPNIASGGTHRADVHWLFSLRQPMPAVQNFLEARVPAGMRLSSYSLSPPSDPGPLTPGGRTADPSSATGESVSFQPGSLPAGIYFAELSASVVPGANGGSLLRADAAVIWYPHRSTAEYLNARRFRAVRISAALLNPRAHTVTRTFTSGAVTGRLARMLNGLPAAPYQPPSRPIIVATFRFTFVPAALAAPRVVVTPTGCLTVQVAVGGVDQRLLWGGDQLISVAMRLLQLKSLV
jgi:hypothetical protein